MAQALTFDEERNVHLNTLQMPSLDGPTSVLVEFLAAPINPIDHLVLSKAYPVKPKTFISGLPVPGYDGIACVLAVGAQVESFAPNDHVVVKTHGLGTWRTHATIDAADLMRIDRTLDPALAAVLRMGVAPAYYMLEENTSHLRVGDWIVHSAATGVIAHFVTQLAKLRGFKVMAVIRQPGEQVSGGVNTNVEPFESTARQLKAHGANAVVSEADLVTGRDGAIFAGRRIMLALDAVGGSVAEAMLGVLSPSAVFVTYGFQSGNAKTPMAVTPSMVWADMITVKGFRLSKAVSTRSSEEQQAVLDWLVSMMKDGKLTPPRLERVTWDRNGGDVLEKMRETLSLDGDKQRLRKIKTVIVFQ